MSQFLSTPRPSRTESRATALSGLAIVPAYNEAGSIGSVIAEIRRVHPDFDVVVVDDGSTDGTGRIAARAGACVLTLAYNLGIGGAMQTGYRYALEQGFEIAVQVDGDGQHDPREIPILLAPILEGRADMVVGTRFTSEQLYKAPFIRRVGMRIFARAVSLIVGQRVTDTTSGFRAVNRRGICLFAVDYPHDYPEVEATVLVHRHKLRMVEVPVAMRVRASGSSSITAVRSIYYMVKVSLALIVGLFRRYTTPLEEE